ncbi:MAG: alpha/beta hydrolase [Deltaproteobacteria bacterium]|nr:MAG: alpha/beta hydrolase [Deltaproteobacteria bacterium]
MSTNTFKFKADDGKELQGYHWLPAGSTGWKGVVQIVHGLAEHAARYERLAKKLNEAHYAVYAYDQRGHGKSIAEPSEEGVFGEVDGWKKMVGDVYTLNRHIAQAHPDTPILLLGHSMGSIISQEYIIQHSDTVHAAALSATVNNPGALRSIGLLVAKIERLRLGARGKSKLLHAMSFGDYNKPFKPNRTDYDWLSRDEAEVDKYANDPLCGFVASTSLWVQFLEGIGELIKEKRRAQVRKALPVYLLTGSKDPVTKMGKEVENLEKSYKKCGLTDVTSKSYPDARHECFNETNRDEVIQDLIHWFDRVTG